MDAVRRRISLLVAVTGVGFAFAAPSGAFAAGTISGTLSDDAATPVVLHGVCVYVLDADAPGPEVVAGPVQTNASGFYSVPGLAADQYKVFFTSAAGCPSGGDQVADEFYLNKGGGDLAGATLVPVTDGTTTTVDATLQRTAPAATVGSISGHLTDRLGEDLEDICIGALDSGGGLVGGSITGPNGTYAVPNLAPGSYRLIFLTDPANCGSGALEPVVTEYYDDKSSLAAANPVTVSAGINTSGINASLVLVDDPVAVDDSPPALLEDASATSIDVLTNDTDDDGDPIAITEQTQPANGTVVITGGGTGLTYVPNANYCNSTSGIPDTFTYTVTGGDTATVSVTVNCVDDDPVAVNDPATVTEDSTSTVIDVLNNDTDVDDGAAKSVDSKTEPAHGTVSVGAGGANVSYTPAANYCGPDSFTYKLTPGTSTATVSVTVTCVNDAADAIDDTSTVAEDSGATTINVRSNDIDPDADNVGGTKDLVTAKTNGAHGAVAVTNGSTDVSYTPAANYCGADAFTYTVAGGDTANVAVTVTCVDDAPAAVNDSKTVAEDSGATSIDVLANDTDVDAGPKTVASKTNGAHGSVAVGAGGANVSYTPDADYCGADSFSYTLNGGSTANVTVDVTCVDDPAPGPDPADPTPAPDTQAPDVRISSGPSGKTKDKTPTFAFSSNDPTARFTCSVDGKPGAPCTSPFTTAKLKKGKHTFTVAARDPAGNASTPASQTFKVKKKKKRR